MRIAIAEDSVLLLDGLTRLLTAEGHEVHAHRTAEALLAAVAAPGGVPDLVITDVRMPPGHTDEGLRAAIALRAAHPGLPILVLSQYVEERYAAELFRGGAHALGYVLKDRVADVDDFLASLTAVAGGGSVIDAEVVSQLLARRGSQPLAALTRRERETLALMAEGLSNAAIAARLTIGVAAVEKNISAIFTKLGLTPAPDNHRRVLAVLHYLNDPADQAGQTAQEGSS